VRGFLWASDLLRRWLEAVKRLDWDGKLLVHVCFWGDENMVLMVSFLSKLGVALWKGDQGLSKNVNMYTHTRRLRLRASVFVARVRVH
jgi:hypothetical protein